MNKQQARNIHIDHLHDLSPCSGSMYKVILRLPPRPPVLLRTLICIKRNAMQPAILDKVFLNCTYNTAFHYFTVCHHRQLQQLHISKNLANTKLLLDKCKALEDPIFSRMALGAFALLSEFGRFKFLFLFPEQKEFSFENS